MKTAKVIREMIFFFGDDEKRIAHALKVYAYALTIGELEGLDGDSLETLVYAAILHDIGIKVANEKYGSCSFKQQETEGPPEAKKILLRLGIGKAVIDRVIFLIAHHHSPAASEGIDFRVLLEADYLVNLEEGNIPLSQKDGILKNHFRTTSGKNILQSIFR
jgi:HD superfamily phosphodiesterase